MKTVKAIKDSMVDILEELMDKECRQLDGSIYRTNDSQG